MEGDDEPGQPLDEGDRRRTGLEPGDARREQPRGRRRDDQDGADEQRPDGVDRRDRREGDDGQQDQVGGRTRAPGRAPIAIVEPRRDPAAPEPGRRGQRRDERDGGDDQLATPDRQQRPEEELIDAGAGREDIAREDDPDGEGSDQHERGRGVPGDRGAAPESLEQRREAAADRERRQSWRDAGRAGDDQTRERSGADAVGEEGEAAKDDLRAEESCDRSEQRDLEGRPLHERELEGVKHENHYLYRDGPESSDRHAAGRGLDRQRRARRCVPPATARAPRGLPCWP